MANKQLITPNLNTVDLPGWCLRLVLHAFGFSYGADFARQEWDRNTTKHTDALPTDVAVPVFYSWNGTIDGITRDWGDVAIYVPGKGVFGTPMRGSAASNRWDPSVEARRLWIGGGAQYLGWTEQLNGTNLIELTQGNDMITKDDVGPVRIVMSEVEGWNGNDIHSGKDDAQIMGAWQGHTWQELIWNGWYKQTVHRQNLTDQITDLNSKLTTANTLTSDQQKQIESLKAQVGDNTKWETLKALVRELVGR